VRPSIGTGATVALALSVLFVWAAPGLARADTVDTVNGVVVQPGGIVVDGDAIVYEGGAVVVDTRPATPDPGLAAFDIDPDNPIDGCLKNYMCLYPRTQYRGAQNMAAINVCCTWVNLATYGMNERTESYHNRTGDDVRLAKGVNGNGDHMCAPKGDDAPTMPDGWVDVVSSIKILANGC
jgi:Peptidase inhibitor family I36